MRSSNNFPIHPPGFSSNDKEAVRSRTRSGNSSIGRGQSQLDERRLDSSFSSASNQPRTPKLEDVVIGGWLHGKRTVRQELIGANRELTPVQVIVGCSTLSYFYPQLVKQLGYTSSSSAQYMVRSTQVRPRSTWGKP